MFARATSRWCSIYRYAKNEIWAQEKEKQKAELARQRHQARLERLEREKQEREAKLRQNATSPAPPMLGQIEADALRRPSPTPKDEQHRRLLTAPPTAVERDA
jgi:electron transport complex protein RnfC